MTEEDLKKLSELRDVTIKYLMAQLSIAQQEANKAEEHLARCKATVELYKSRIARYKD